ncbi:MAG: hypothetical protein K2J74_08215 [Muribaculaceae bacterium]|nr:hypothetical protein [Muribaculaceae bacterium]
MVKDYLGIFYVKMTHLSDNNLEWIQPASRYYYATFTSDSQKISTMKVNQIFKNNDKSRFYLFGTGNKYEANAGYDYVIEQDENNFDGSFIIFRDIKNDSLEFTASLSRFSTNHEYPLKGYSMQIGETIFTDCLLMDNTNSGYKYQPEEDEIRINKFIISKEFGLIYYQLYSGEEYFRKFD